MYKWMKRSRKEGEGEMREIFRVEAHLKVGCDLGMAGIMVM